MPCSAPRRALAVSGTFLRRRDASGAPGAAGGRDERQVPLGMELHGLAGLAEEFELRRRELGKSLIGGALRIVVDHAARLRRCCSRRALLATEPRPANLQRQKRCYRQ